jgi:hypothetical protein
MRARGGLILTNTLIEIVQTIKQNQSDIRTTPGTALKHAINGELVYSRSSSK